MPDPLTDPIRQALQTTHHPLGLHNPLASKYRADVTPFAFLAENTPAAVLSLASLLLPGEYTWVLGDKPPRAGGVHCTGPHPCLQMLFPAATSLPPEAPGPTITRLSCADAPAMVALTDAAFPGFFRPRTCEMGNYYGVWDTNPAQTPTLLAMGGERLIFEPFREISAVCTLPSHRGQGLATHILGHILRAHRSRSRTSFLHVTSTNTNAIALYHRLGFLTVREVHLYRLALQRQP